MMTAWIGRFWKACLGVLCLAAIALVGCGSSEQRCEADRCSGHGTCDASTGAILCTCEVGYTGEICASCAVGYHDDGTSVCVPDGLTCEADSCSGHGTCDDSTGAILCTCDTGYSGVVCDGCAIGYHDDGTGDCAQDSSLECGYHPPLSAVGLGSDYGCAIAGGEIACFGDNSDHAAAPPTRSAFSQVSAASSAACGVKEDGTMECWGSSFFALEGWDYRQVATGFRGPCAVTRGGEIVCAPHLDGQELRPVGTGWQKVVSAGWSYCAIHEDGHVQCWQGEDQPALDVPDEAFTDLRGGRTSCGLLEDGSARCWGNNNHGQADVPTDEHFMQIAVGDYHGCGIRLDGTVACWGIESVLVHGYIQPPELPGPAREIAVGAKVTCAILENGEAKCWGPTDFVWSMAPPAGPLHGLTLDFLYACALTEVGDPVCWSASSIEEMVPAPSRSPFVSVAVGPTHACALKTDGTIACWGKLASSVVPVVWRGNDFVQVEATLWWSCGLHADGRVDCWGDMSAPEPPAETDYEQIDLDTFTPLGCGVTWDHAIRCWGAPGAVEGLGAPPVGEFDQVTIGRMFACGLHTTGEITCWGQNHYGQTDAPSGDDFIQIASSSFSSCALRQDGSIECWGIEYETPGPDEEVATLVGAIYDVCALSTSGVLTCAGSWDGSPADQGWIHGATDVRAGSRGWCWLRDGRGHCTAGIGQSAATDLQALQIGRASACGLRSDGSVECWLGINDVADDGQIAVPDGHYVALATGPFSACVLDADGSPTCWGADSVGGVDTPEGEHFVAIDAVAASPSSAQHCGLHEDGSILCWTFRDHLAGVDPLVAPPDFPPLQRFSVGGAHLCGIDQLGQVQCFGTTLGITDVPTGSDFVEIDCGDWHCCALRDDGEVACWGNAVDDVANTRSPTADVPPGPFSSITSGSDFACGLRPNSSVQCWGTRTVDWPGQFSCE